MEKGKERTSISGRYAIGNAHQRTTRMKPKVKYAIRKENNMTKKKGKREKRRSDNEEDTDTTT